MLPRLLAATIALLAAQACAAVPPPPFASPEGVAPLPDAFPLAPEGAVDGQPKPSVQDFLARQGPRLDDPGVPFSSQWAKALEAMLVAGEYGRIEKISRNEFRNSVGFTEWLTQNAQSVDVRLMWTLAERHALARRGELTARWAYAALLGTQQETATCLGNEPRNAIALLTASHPTLTAAIRQQPFYIKEAKEFAFALLRKAPRYADPGLWLCRPYALEAHRASPGRVLAYEAVYHPFLRARERNRLHSLWRMGGLPEPIPSMPQPDSGTAPR